MSVFLLKLYITNQSLCTYSENTVERSGFISDLSKQSRLTFRQNTYAFLDCLLFVSSPAMAKHSPVHHPVQKKKLKYIFLGGYHSKEHLFRLSI